MEEKRCSYDDDDDDIVESEILVYFVGTALWAAVNEKVFSFFLNSFVLVVSLMSTQYLFHAFGPATGNDISDETSLFGGTHESCSPVERSA